MAAIMGPVSPVPSESTHLAPDVDVVAQLIRDQAPHLADLPVRVSPASGSSNWVFRLGEALSVRLPRADEYVDDLLKEVRWLPHLAPHLVSPVPGVIAVGESSQAFPRPWAVLSWLPGDLPHALDEAQQVRFAETLGAFAQSLHAVDTTGAPRGAEHWGYRCGEPVTDQIDTWAERAATALADRFDAAAVREAWRRLRRVPAATQPVCWVHTDLSAENVLVGDDGRLAGVIDFGGLGIGDPSVDLLYAWSLLDAPARDVLRAAAGADEATWARARTWAFVGPGLLTIAGYRHSMPARSERLGSMVESIAAEVGVELR
ncbi:aminoglycoside phosphotransferase family protein [Nocardioides sp. LS1]|uniref:aminoglycoside phosphotransferase family protein n=1 Tax=Nocardioides sp. LS1 TaxID=1027620 RepID=UPI001C8B9255|nr:aminoglycoside phosphotransferase family protein [Nocardioides sp. LS1]